MTVKELIEELKEIDKKYQDHEVILFHSGSADKWDIMEVGKENEWEDEEEIYITISQKGKRKKMNTSKETVEYIIKFNKSLYDKLSKNGIEDSDYPFAKRIVVEKVDIGSKKEQSLDS